MPFSFGLAQLSTICMGPATDGDCRLVKVNVHKDQNRGTTSSSERRQVQYLVITDDLLHLVCLLLEGCHPQVYGHLSLPDGDGLRDCVTR